VFSIDIPSTIVLSGKAKFAAFYSHVEKGTPPIVKSALAVLEFDESDIRDGAIDHHKTQVKIEDLSEAREMKDNFAIAVYGRMRPPYYAYANRLDKSAVVEWREAILSTQFVYMTANCIAVVDRRNRKVISELLEDN
jgi:hypothetical protein